jgi:DNA polymerase III delta prime subunit
MALKKTKRKPLAVNPKILLLYGPPKVGKTTVLSQLNDCLVIDTERGSHMLEGYFHGVDNKEKLLEFYKDASEGHDYKVFALDTIDKIVEWTTKEVVSECQVDDIADLPYGKGYGMVRERTMNNIRKLQSLCPQTIIVGHRKTAAAVDNSTAVDPETLDLSGKLRNQIMAQSDAIGYMFRDDEDKLMVSFKAAHAVEAGSRCEHLKGKVFPFDWKKIYVKEGK